MPIVFCSLELYLPYCHSLKEKRNVLRSLSGRIRSRFRFAVSEIDYQDTWQHGRLGAVGIGPDRHLLEQLARELIAESEKVLGGDLVRHEIEFFEYD